MLFPPTVLLALVASVVVVSIGGALLQGRLPRAPLAALIAICLAFALAVALAKAGVPSLREVPANLASGIAGFALPGTASLGALVIFRRFGPHFRVLLAVTAGGVATVCALPAGVVVACFLLGDCL